MSHSNDDFDDIHFLVEFPPGTSWTVGDGPNGTFLLMATLPSEPTMMPLNKKLQLEIPMQFELGERDE